MNTKSMAYERISALADGELVDGCIEVALAALRQSEGRSAWDMYHQIGDVLRSDDMGFKLHPDFMTRLSARLETEPSIIAPIAVESTVSFERVTEKMGDGLTKRPIKRTMPIIIGATLATLAFMIGPQLMMTMKGSSTIMNANIPIAGDSPKWEITSSSAMHSSPTPIISNSTSTLEGIILRDPRIDDYLLAHQRFSPSVYSTAQYARPATFATGSEK